MCIQAVQKVALLYGMLIKVFDSEIFQVVDKVRVAGTIIITPI